VEPQKSQSRQRANRASGWENVVATALADLRYAARGLQAAPGFTTITVLTLALAIGGTAAIFSAVNPILFEPLPYPDPGRIVAIWDFSRDGSRLAATFGTYRELVQRSRSFDAIAVLKPWQPTMTGADQPERFEGQRVGASYFHVLGVSPVIGRDFQASDDRLGGPNVVNLSRKPRRKPAGRILGLADRTRHVGLTIPTVP
jgi:putative ABC transport system permease protein